jgi:hypothetical protein
VLLFVDQVLVDRLGTLGAPDWIDEKVVLDVLDAANPYSISPGSLIG